jgi:phosphopantothenoylcysteine decarboxylase / phosphopantothenate---cysteine ligase
MADALDKEFPTCEILIMAAAVADARPKSFSSDKIKKSNYQNIELEANPDLLANISKKRSGNQVLVAFAAETLPLNSEGVEAAKAKMKHKGSDLIYLNNVGEGAIFGADETAGLLIDSNGESIECKNQSKDTLADLLLDRALNKLG